ncbi:MAG: Eco29kI family restriction endonuclease [Bryobacterales bacterium]|nr:Eco29kI family restriction endonuclease [Bryobacterales bacterium]
MPDLWDPLTYENLMAGTVAHFEKQRPEPLTISVNIDGPGIYALYYTGEFADYEPIADGRCPIYVGKAAPPGARKGSGEVDVEVPALRRRLREHAKSIASADNLKLEDFSFRALAIVPVWIAFAEQALIKQYEPVWNSCLEGFGKHDQGKNRVGTLRSWWDTLHPGRRWARVAFRGATGGRTAAEASELVEAYFAKRSDQ